MIRNYAHSSTAIAALLLQPCDLKISTLKHESAHDQLLKAICILQIARHLCQLVFASLRTKIVARKHFASHKMPGLAFRNEIFQFVHFLATCMKIKKNYCRNDFLLKSTQETLSLVKSIVHSLEKKKTYSWKKGKTCYPKIGKQAVKKRKTLSLKHGMPFAEGSEKHFQKKG